MGCAVSGADGQDVTLGEVYRAVTELRADFKDLQKGFVSRVEYDADKAGHAQARAEASARIDGIVKFAAWAAGVAVTFLCILVAFALPHIAWH